jgi:hypothetical protein
MITIIINTVMTLITGATTIITRPIRTPIIRMDPRACARRRPEPANRPVMPLV